jgi:hypothetical protein
MILFHECKAVSTVLSFRPAAKPKHTRQHTDSPPFPFSYQRCHWMKTHANTVNEWKHTLTYSWPFLFSSKRFRVLKAQTPVWFMTSQFHFFQLRGWDQYALCVRPWRIIIIIHCTCTLLITRQMCVFKQNRNLFNIEHFASLSLNTTYTYIVSIDWLSLLQEI